MVDHAMTALLVSPHAWGWTSRITLSVPTPCGIPTRVGVDLGAKCPVRGLYRYPHTRGGGPMARFPGLWALRVSPHAWGWTECNLWPRPWCVGIPTRVGVDRARLR